MKPELSGTFWWSQTGSNRRPEACKATALPTELWPRSEKQSLKLVGLGGFEPPTSRLSSARSNQLSYRPEAQNLEETLSARPKTSKALAQNAPVTADPMSADQAHRPEKERETKTARFRMSKPDWLLLFQANSIQGQRPRGEFYLRKEVIQPQVPLRLPCYDFTPVADPTVVDCLLAVSAAPSGKTNSHGVTGGVYKARERIHRGMLIHDY